jgi:hypothetical protein
MLSYKYRIGKLTNVAHVKAIVAYLYTVKPVSNKVADSKWNIPQQAMPPAKGLPAPAKTDKVAYGGYIVNSLAHCFECHSPPDAHGAPDFAHRPGGAASKSRWLRGWLCTRPISRRIRRPGSASAPWRS